MSGRWATGRATPRGQTQLLRPKSEWGRANEDAEPKMTFTTSFGVPREDILKKLIDKEIADDFALDTATKESKKKERTRISRKHFEARRELRERWQTARRTWKHQRFADEEEESVE